MTNVLLWQTYFYDKRTFKTNVFMTNVPLWQMFLWQVYFYDKYIYDKCIYDKWIYDKNYWAPYPDWEINRNIFLFWKKQKIIITWNRYGGIFRLTQHCLFSSKFYTLPLVIMVLWSSPSPDWEIEEINIFPGSSNKLNFERVYTKVMFLFCKVRCDQWTHLLILTKIIGFNNNPKFYTTKNVE